MAKSSLSRREFLKVSALGASALALNSCSTLDNYFMGDARDFRNEVIILGAGAAGLAAAFELKRRKIPFRLFEASGRIGGRVQSLNLFASEGPVAELGAEFFDASHSQVLRLAKDLGVTVSEIKSMPSVEAHLFSFNQKIYRSQEVAAKLKNLQRPLTRVRSDLFQDQDVMLTYKNSVQYERSQYYDSLSLKDLLESWRSEVDPVILKLVEEQAVTRFGVEASAQSALHFLETLDSEGSSLLGGRPQLRMDGGLSSLMQALVDRVSGVIPDQVVKMNHPLVEISEIKGVFLLTFATPKGRQTFLTQNVICTMPFSKLREVKGVTELQFGALKKEAILQQGYATHSKGVLPFAAPFWRNKRGTTPANLGNFTGDFTSEKIWDSGRGQLGEHGLLTFQRGGQRGLQAGEAALREGLKDLELFYTHVPEAKLDLGQMVNWSQKPWAQGSMAVFKPGQYTKFKGVAGEPEYSGRFLFAGEHTSLRFAGTLQGALESGFKAASEITI